MIVDLHSNGATLRAATYADYGFNQTIQENSGRTRGCFANQVSVSRSLRACATRIPSLVW